jgi:hypothetical protein
MLCLFGTHVTGIAGRGWSFGRGLVCIHQEMRARRGHEPEKTRSLSELTCHFNLDEES